MNIIETTKGTNKIELFLSDLTEEAQNKLVSEVFNGDNGNYDVFPLAIIEFEKTV